MKLSFINPSRRDLMKHFAALGVTGVVSSSANAQQSINGSHTVWRGEEGYEESRYGMMYKANVPDRYPDLILKAETEADIYAALDFARKNDMQIVCRSSGHNSAGAVLRNGGMLLDLSSLKGVALDTVNRTATVGPATTLVELVTALKDAGLDFPYGTCDSVSVGGYLMGGGFGRNGNYYCQGPACYALKSADIILAEGRKVTASDEENQDILWTLRGCGPGFYGIVASYTIEVFEPTQALVTRSYTHALKDLPRVRRFAESASESMDDRIALNINFSFDANDDQVVITTITAASTSTERPEDEAKALIDACAEKGLSKGALQVGAVVVHDVNAELYHFEKHMSTNTDNFYVDSLDALIPMQHLHKQAPRAKGARITLSCTVNLFRHPMRPDACLTHRGRHMILHHVTWNANEVEDREAFEQTAYEWMGKFNDFLAPFGKGHFINQADNDRYPERIPASFTPETWDRLTALRRRYDPENLFYTYLGQS